MNRQPYLPLLATFGDSAMATVFGEEGAIAAWLEVERALAAAEAELGVISADAAAAIARAARADAIDREALREAARTVGYPILPLLEQLREATGDGMPDEVAAAIHWGATTQDIMDTALVLQIRAALERIEELSVGLGDHLAALARDHRSTVMAGRTHAQQAVPTTFGAKIAVWLAELGRHLDRLDSLRARVLVVSLFGAAGTGAALGPASRGVRHALARQLGLRAVDVPWHTARDGIAEFGFVLGSIAATCGKIGREVIELSRPEIAEVREAAGHHRGASSTMPHKANPISSEVVVGMSILAAHQASSLLSAMAAGHERSAGEWQVEWDAVPGLAALAAGCLLNALEIAAGLTVFPERMRANLLVDGGMLMSEGVMMKLAVHVGRSRAHDIVYGACLEAGRSGRALLDVLPERLDPALLAALPPLGQLTSPDSYLGEAEQTVDTALDLWRTRNVGPVRSRRQPRDGTDR